MLHRKKNIVLYFKEDIIDSEKLQSVVSSLPSRERIVQAAPSKKISRKGKGKRRRESANEREKKKEKEKKEEKGKEEKKKRKKWRERY